MKTEFYPKSLIFLLIGIIIGIMIMYLVGMRMNNQCCTGLCSTGLPPVKKITTKEAVAAVTCYRKNPISVQNIKGFTVNLQQLHAMNKLYMENNKLTGFRLYFGIVGDPVDVTIVCGVTDNNDMEETDYVTTRTSSGPCPVYCDKDSELGAAGE